MSGQALIEISFAIMGWWCPSRFEFFQGLHMWDKSFEHYVAEFYISDDLTLSISGIDLSIYYSIFWKLFVNVTQLGLKFLTEVL